MQTSMFFACYYCLGIINSLSSLIRYLFVLQDVARSNTSFFPPKSTGSAFWGKAGSSVRLASFIGKTPPGGSGSDRFKSFRQSYRRGK